MSVRLVAQPWLSRIFGVCPPGSSYPSELRDGDAGTTWGCCETGFSKAGVKIQDLGGPNLLNSINIRRHSSGGRSPVCCLFSHEDDKRAADLGPANKPPALDNVKSRHRWPRAVRIERVVRNKLPSNPEKSRILLPPTPRKALFWFAREVDRDWAQRQAGTGVP
jgi:hypothetical protein